LGCFYTLFQLNAIECFGLKASGKLLGTITVLDAFGGGFGIFLTGKMFDMYGSYQPAFVVFAILVAIAVVLISQIKKHVQRQVKYAASLTSKLRLKPISNV